MAAWIPAAPTVDAPGRPLPPPRHGYRLISSALGVQPRREAEHRPGEMVSFAP